MRACVWVRDAAELRSVMLSRDGTAYGPAPGAYTCYVASDATYRIDDCEIASGPELHRAVADAGLKPCGTWAGVARQVLPYPFVRRCPARALVGASGAASIGGWIWHAPGATLERAVQVDVNKAYQWSLASRVSWAAEPPRVHEGYRRGASLVIAHVTGGGRMYCPAPPNVRPRDAVKVVAMTPRELEEHSFSAVVPAWSVTYGRDRIDFDRAFQRSRIAHWPRAWRDQVARVAWGVFASPGGYGTLWRGGHVTKTWRNKNQYWDVARAHAVAQGVRTLVYESLPYVEGVCRIYVDSLLCSACDLRLGDAPGQWRIARRYGPISVEGGRVHEKAPLQSIGGAPSAEAAWA